MPMTNTDNDQSHVDFESWCNVRKRDSPENKAGVLAIPFDQNHEQNVAHVKGNGGAVNSRPDK